MKRPDIVWIFTDEQRADSVGCYGSLANTPNLDFLARRGILFGNHHVNSPQCVPSRTSMLSGVYPHQTGAVDNSACFHPEEWPEKYISFPEIFAQHGYVTANLGKVHTPPHNTWQECINFQLFDDEADHWELKGDYDEKLHEIIHRKDDKDVILSGRYPYVAGGRTPATRLTDMAIDWLGKHAGKKEPFLLRVSYLWPHTPVLAPEPFYSMYDTAGMPFKGWEEAKKEVLTDYDGAFLERSGNYSLTTENVKRIWATYLGLVTHLDDQIGRLIREMDKLGILEDAIIVFTSDHGDLLGEHGLFQKGTFHQESTRVPYIISWRGRLPEGKTVDGLTDHIDFGPTLLNLAGIEIPRHYEGAPILKKPDEILEKKYIFGEIFIRNFKEKLPHRFWIRTKRYSMNVSWFDKDGKLLDKDKRDGFLSDLLLDPGGKNNVYNTNKYAGIRAMLEQKLGEWYESTV